MAWALIAAGAFSVCGAWMDWDFFMNSRKARLFVNLFGRGGARVFYGLLGATILTMGALMAAGVLSTRR